jgi:magnesium-transporting ATPase (P-type)
MDSGYCEQRNMRVLILLPLSKLLLFQVAMRTYYWTYVNHILICTTTTTTTTITTTTTATDSISTNTTVSQVAMRTHNWTWINHVLIWLSIILYFPFLAVLSYIWQWIGIEGVADMSGVALTLFASPNFWLGSVLLAPGLSLLPDIALDAFQRTFFPLPFQVYQVSHTFSRGFQYFISAVLSIECPGLHPDRQTSSWPLSGSTTFLR